MLVKNTIPGNNLQNGWLTFKKSTVCKWMSLWDPDHFMLYPWQPFPSPLPWQHKECHLALAGRWGTAGKSQEPRFYRHKIPNWKVSTTETCFSWFWRLASFRPGTHMEGSWWELPVYCLLPVTSCGRERPSLCASFSFNF